MADFFARFGSSATSGAGAHAEQALWIRTVKTYQKVGPVYLILAIVLNLQY